jgi:hypothetical protein
VDDRDLHVPEPGGLKQAGQFRFREAEPYICVHLTRFLEAVLAQVHDDHAAGAPQDPGCFRERYRRVECVMQRLVKQRYVGLRITDRQLLEIT